MLDLLVFLVLLVTGYLSGRWIEKRHFRSIIEREQALRHLLTFSSRQPPVLPTPVSSELVAGNVVISIDYFKRVVSTLRNLVGGRVSAYESLVERARREAILRMKAAAAEKGATHIFNVKLETASIYKGAGNQIGSVEVYAYGTAFIPESPCPERP